MSLQQSIGEFLREAPVKPEHILISPLSNRFGGVTQQIGRALRAGKTVGFISHEVQSAEELMTSIRNTRLKQKEYFTSTYTDHRITTQITSRAVPMYIINDMDWVKQFDGQIIAVSYDHHMPIVRGQEVSHSYLATRLNSHMSKYRVNVIGDDIQFLNEHSGRVEALMELGHQREFDGSWIVIKPDSVQKVNPNGHRAWVSHGVERYNEAVRMSGKV